MTTKKGTSTQSHQIQITPPAASESSLEARWGDIILDAGHTSIPNLLLELYSELGISNHEMMFIIHIFNYRWSKKNPHPAVSTIAKKMNVSHRNAQRYIQRLKTLTYQTDQEKQEGKQPVPFLIVKERYRTDSGQLSNLYDFSGLTAAIVKLALIRGLVTDPASEAEGNTPPDKNVIPPPDKFFTPPLTKTSPEEEISKKKKNKKKQLSNIRTANAQNSQGNGDTSPNGTYSHIALAAIGNDKKTEENTGVGKRRTSKTSRPGQIGLTKIGDLLQERMQEFMTQAPAAPPKLSNGYTEEEDAIALYIEPYSRELGDETHCKSNVRQAINIYTDIKQEIPEFTVGQYLYILETFKNLVQYRRGVKNKMAYYFKSLRNHLWPPEKTGSLPN